MEDSHVPRTYRDRQAVARAQETPVQTQARRTTDQEQHAAARARESPVTQPAHRDGLAAYRSQPWRNMLRAAFSYDTTLNYEDNPQLQIGAMTSVCGHCGAKKWKNETPGMCCMVGKVQLPSLNAPPEPLRSLLNGTHPHSTHFLENIRSYNNCFQMTSFGGREIREGNFMPTFIYSLFLNA